MKARTTARHSHNSWRHARSVWSGRGGCAVCSTLHSAHATSSGATRACVEASKSCAPNCVGCNSWSRSRLKYLSGSNLSFQLFEACVLSMRSPTASWRPRAATCVSFCPGPMHCPAVAPCPPPTETGRRPWAPIPGRRPTPPVAALGTRHLDVDGHSPRRGRFTLKDPASDRAHRRGEAGGAAGGRVPAQLGAAVVRAPATCTCARARARARARR